MKDTVVVILPFHGDLPCGDSVKVISCTGVKTVVSLIEEGTGAFSAEEKNGTHYVQIPVISKNGGSLCSALMAADYLTESRPLLLCSPNEIDLISTFCEKHPADADCALWLSQTKNGMGVRFLENDLLMVSEEPGEICARDVLWFSDARSFVETSKTIIIKGKPVGTPFVLADVVNEMLLCGKNVSACKN